MSVLILSAVLLGCGGSSAPAPAPDAQLDRTVDRVEEAFDVPPPPRMRTVQLFGVDPTGFELGEPVTVLRGGTAVLVGDLVLDVQDPPSLVVYVPEERADALLSETTGTDGPITVTPGR